MRDPAGGWVGHRCAPRRRQELPHLHPAAARHGLHRHLSPGTRRSRRADRGHGRRHRGHGEGRLRSPHRPLRSRRGHHPSRPRRASHRRPADRILALLPRHRGRHSAGLPRARHRHHRLRRALARPASAATGPRSASLPDRTSAPTARASRARTSTATSPSSKPSAPSPRPKASPSPRPRSAGSSRKARTSSPCSEPAAATVSPRR